MVLGDKVLLRVVESNANYGKIGEIVRICGNDVVVSFHNGNTVQTRFDKVRKTTAADEKKNEPKPKKVVEVETDKNGNVRMDGVLVRTDDVLMDYKGFDFSFTKACWLVSEGDVAKTKKRFHRLGLIKEC